MQKSYVAKSPINFVQFSFRVNAGDILVHDTVNQKLTVYRNGQIVKTLKQSSLGMSALLKDHSAEEVVEHKPKVEKPRVEAPKPVPQPIAPEETLRMLQNVPKLKPDLPTSLSPKNKEEKKRPPIKIEIPEPIVKGKDEKPV